MKVLYCGYRDWALECYDNLIRLFPQHHFHLARTKEELDFALGDEEFELLLFVGWSWIVRSEVINTKYCVCLHPSPLPKYRGGSPIQNQIINGENLSAVTLFHMDDELDHGPIIFQEEFSLHGTLEEILKRISQVGLEGLTQLLLNFPNVEEIEQNELNATKFSRRKPEMSEITLEEIRDSSALQIHNKIRSLQSPYPEPFITCGDGSKIYLLETKIDN